MANQYSKTKLEKFRKAIEEKIPVDTAKIIKEAEDTLVLKEEVKQKEAQAF